MRIRIDSVTCHASNTTPDACYLVDLGRDALEVMSPRGLHEEQMSRQTSVADASGAVVHSKLEPTGIRVQIGETVDTSKEQGSGQSG